jgi:hypothetical protein
MPHLPTCVVLSEAGQADEGYIILALSLYSCLRSLHTGLRFHTKEVHIVKKKCWVRIHCQKITVTNNFTVFQIYKNTWTSHIYHVFVMLLG